MSEFTVRLAEPGEYAAVGALTRDAYVADGFESADSEYAARLVAAAHRAENAELYVAVDGAGTPLGTVTYCPPGSAYAQVSGPAEGEFRMLAVAPAARGRGVAEALVRALLQRAGDAGMSALVMVSATYMTAAHRLYHRLGFVRAPELDWQPRADTVLHGYRLRM